MTDNDIRIAIAEACGYEHCNHDTRLWKKGGRFYWITGGPFRGTSFAPLPDYPNDLNACAEFWAKMDTAELQNRYIAALAEVCWADEGRANNQVVFNQVTATARQHCETFLRALNLWKP